MEIWYAIPTANADRCSKAFEAWKDMGYMTMAYVDKPEQTGIKHCDQLVFAPEYLGWSATTNRLCRLLKTATWIVAGGDDMLPDPSKRAAEIAEECTAYFGGTLGVMQPHGDKFKGTTNICGSPWIGREYADRGNGGMGAMRDEYFHFYADEELLLVATAQGLLWSRSDLVQYHDHWTRNKQGKTDYQAHNNKYWEKDKSLFVQRKQLNFPGSELL